MILVPSPIAAIVTEPYGGWVSSDRAPSHLRPSTCPAINNNDKTKGHYYDPSQTQGPQQKCPLQRADKKHDCAVTEHWVAAAHKARQPKVWYPSIHNPSQQRYNRQINRATRECTGEFQGCRKSVVSAKERNGERSSKGGFQGCGALLDNNNEMIQKYMRHGTTKTLFG